jgi:hypothetical protein
MSFDWQTPLSLAVVIVAAAGLLIRAWRKHRRPSAGGCASGGEGCGCSAVKKNLRVR